MKVVWDRAKDIANKKKHGVSFREASELLTPAWTISSSSTMPTRTTRTASFPSAPIRRGLDLVVWTERDDSTSGSSVLVEPRGASSRSFASM